MTGADTEIGHQRALDAAASGSAVILVGDDAGRLGAAAAAVRATYDVRTAIHVGDPSDDDLRQMIAELFGTDPV